MKHICLLMWCVCIISITMAQEKSELDSLYIEEIENKNPAKILHAEPLYIDLIRDLGARKGEKEWNIGFGLTDETDFDRYEALVEYEFAPINRLGFEVELPFSFHYPINGTSEDSIPGNRLESLKLAVQWSFFVNEKIATSMAIGYINEIELPDFKNFGNPVVTGNVYNPFFVAAKRWGNNIHTLIYTGPRYVQHYYKGHNQWLYDMNLSFHYMIPGTKNFMGIEFNQTTENGHSHLVMRPQMRLSVADNIMVGIVAGIPVKKEQERFSSFLRLIWEPGHRNAH